MLDNHQYVGVRFALGACVIARRRGGNYIEINDIGMIVKNGEIPVAVIGWESAASLDFNQNDAYFTTVNGLIFIIEKDKLVQGDFDMLGELAAKRMVKQDDELSA